MQTGEIIAVKELFGYAVAEAGRVVWGCLKQQRKLPCDFEVAINQRADIAELRLVVEVRELVVHAGLQFADFHVEGVELGENLVELTENLIELAIDGPQTAHVYAHGAHDLAEGGRADGAQNSACKAFADAASER